MWKQEAGDKKQESQAAKEKKDGVNYSGNMEQQRFAWFYSGGTGKQERMNNTGRRGCSHPENSDPDHSGPHDKENQAYYSGLF